MKEAPGARMGRVWNPFCFCADEPELGAYQTGDWCHRMAHVQRDHPVRLTILALSRLALSRQLEGGRLHNTPPPLGRLTGHALSRPDLTYNKDTAEARAWEQKCGGKSG
jgi:hypothetical protein